MSRHACHYTSCPGACRIPFPTVFPERPGTGQLLSSKKPAVILTIKSHLLSLWILSLWPLVSTSFSVLCVFSHPHQTRLSLRAEPTRFPLHRALGKQAITSLPWNLRITAAQGMGWRAPSGMGWSRDCRSSIPVWTQELCDPHELDIAFRVSMCIFRWERVDSLQ